VSFRVGGYARNNIGAETLVIAVVLVVADVVASAEAHYLEASSPHCGIVSRRLGDGQRLTLEGK
jgi:hypothetical protein